MNPSPATPSTSRPVSRGEKTRRDILAVAVDIASVEGLEGLTIGRLSRELQMSKSGLFAHFGSKQELQLATISTARQIFEEQVLPPGMQQQSGLARLAALMEAWTTYVEKCVFRGGCFFGAASAEFDGRPGAVRDRIAQLTKFWFDRLTEEAQTAQSLSQISMKVDPVQLSFELHAFVQEANWAYQLLDDKQAFDRARQAIHDRLQSAATPTGLRLLRAQKSIGTRSPKRKKSR